MVVGDDEVDAEFFGDDCGVGCSDAAVDGDDDFGACISEGLDGGFVEAVAFIEAVGDVGVDFGVGCDDTEHVVEDGGGGDAVDIIITEDGDWFIVFDGIKDALCGFVEVWDEGGVVESREGWAEEGVAGLGVGEASGGHDAVY